MNITCACAVAVMWPAAGANARASTADTSARRRHVRASVPGELAFRIRRPCGFVDSRFEIIVSTLSTDSTPVVAQPPATDGLRLVLRGAMVRVPTHRLSVVLALGRLLTGREAKLGLADPVSASDAIDEFHAGRER